MSTQAITVNATVKGGVLRPLQALPLSEHQRVTLTVQETDLRWPADVAAIYQECDEENGRLARGS